MNINRGDLGNTKVVKGRMPYGARPHLQGSPLAAISVALDASEFTADLTPWLDPTFSCGRNGPTPTGVMAIYPTASLFVLHFSLLYLPSGDIL